MIRKYKDAPRPAGVYRIRNEMRGRSLLGSSPNVPGMLNRVRFQLEDGSHPDKELQADWNELGPGAFEFETLDLLKQSDDPGQDPSDDLDVLKQMWLEKLTATGEEFYPQTIRS